MTLRSPEFKANFLWGLGLTLKLAIIVGVVGYCLLTPPWGWAILATVILWDWAGSCSSKIRALKLRDHQQ